ncbi:MAG: cellulase [Acidobacteriota bacterium]|nr:cellulase [Acidobacteriota bacterium]
MDRRTFLTSAAAGLTLSQTLRAQAGTATRLRDIRRPLAITMWDFSWLERRWLGAGYEDWDLALDELVARGYDAVRIDAYPHLIAAGADRTWELIPVWSLQDWGSPAKNRVRVQPALNQFIKKCGDRGLRVALSTWFRQDTGNTRLKIHTAQQHGQIWKTTLDSIAANGLLKHLLYVDLCNEFPLDVWAPFVPKGMLRATPRGARWMNDAIAVVRKSYPDLDYTFSITSEWNTWRKQDVSMLDFLELHIWMANASEFYDKVGYHYERFDPKGYENVVDRAKPLYLSKPDYWKGKLRDRIQLGADWSRLSKRPLITTECWSLVDYKDWPLLDWDWLKDLCEVGVTTAAATGRWVAMATSNFCGPQFVGMWRDIPWHKRLTEAIHNSEIQPL